MSKVSGNELIDDVTPGDLIAVDRGSGERPYKVVFKDATDGAISSPWKATAARPFNSTCPPAPG